MALLLVGCGTNSAPTFPALDASAPSTDVPGTPGADAAQTESVSNATGPCLAPYITPDVVRLGRYNGSPIPVNIFAYSNCQTKTLSTTFRGTVHFVNAAGKDWMQYAYTKADAGVHSFYFGVPQTKGTYVTTLKSQDGYNGAYTLIVQ